MEAKNAIKSLEKIGRIRKKYGMYNAISPERLENILYNNSPTSMSPKGANKKQS